MRKPELLAPAGDFESLAAALRSGADSVYFGIGKMNMRSRSSANFKASDLNRIVRLCRRCSVKAYLALNTIVYDNELDTMRQLCDDAKAAGVNAVIASDFSCIDYANSIGMPVHVSVQANVSNTDAVKFFAKFADVVVLARELELQQIKDIVGAIESEDVRGPSGETLRVELFVHGALCVSISGKCYMSLAAYNTSGNRGECFQNCRRRYRVTDEETGFELVLDDDHVMSPSDLCTIRIIDKIIDSGVSILKIEGRGRSADYVAATTNAYRQAIDLICSTGHAGPSAGELASRLRSLEDKLESVFNRGFWHGGYYLGDEAGQWSRISGNKASMKKHPVGIVTNFFSRKQIAEITVLSNNVSSGDTLLFTGATTGAQRMLAEDIRLDGNTVQNASRGDVVSVRTPFKLRRNDKVYVLREEA